MKYVMIILSLAMIGCAKKDDILGPTTTTTDQQNNNQNNQPTGTTLTGGTGTTLTSGNQNSPPVVITGHVFALGSPLAGATIQFPSLTLASVTTDSTGAFGFTSITAASYDMHISKNGYQIMAAGSNGIQKIQIAQSKITECYVTLNRDPTSPLPVTVLSLQVSVGMVTWTTDSAANYSVFVSTFPDSGGFAENGELKVGSASSVTLTAPIGKDLYIYMVTANVGQNIQTKTETNSTITYTLEYPATQQGTASSYIR